MGEWKNVHLFPQMQLEYIYKLNNSHKANAEQLQKTLDTKKDKNNPCINRKDEARREKE